MSEQTKYTESQTQEANLQDADQCDALAVDPVIEAYKKHVDRTILRENLKLSPQERSEKFQSFMRSIWQLREAASRPLRS